MRWLFLVVVLLCLAALWSRSHHRALSVGPDVPAATFRLALPVARDGPATVTSSVYQPPSFPSDRPLTREEMKGLLHYTGWPSAVTPAALRVAWCESRFDPRALGPFGHVGLFQLDPHYHAWRASGPLTDPVHNAIAALSLWEEQGWSPWSCPP